MANTEFIKEWVAELRSGNRAQTRGTLCEIDSEGNKSFCCLGVAMDMLAERGVIESMVLVEKTSGRMVGAFPYPYSNGEPIMEQGMLNIPAMGYMGIENNNPIVDLPETTPDWDRPNGDYRSGNSSLAELNDAGMTFEQIADVIEYFFSN